MRPVEIRLKLIKIQLKKAYLRLRIWQCELLLAFLTVISNIAKRLAARK